MQINVAFTNEIGGNQLTQSATSTNTNKILAVGYAAIGEVKDIFVSVTFFDAFKWSSDYLENHPGGKVNLRGYSDAWLKKELWSAEIKSGTKITIHFEE